MGSETALIIVLPAYDEPDPCLPLKSLAECIKPDSSFEVIVVANIPSDSASDVIIRHEQMISKISSFASDHPDLNLKLLDVRPNTKVAGVGYARKTGMDLAYRILCDSGRPDGVILCLDADC